jgi:hypothetical protein
VLALSAKSGRVAALGRASPSDDLRARRLTTRRLLLRHRGAVVRGGRPGAAGGRPSRQPTRSAVRDCDSYGRRSGRRTWTSPRRPDATGRHPPWPKLCASACPRSPGGRVARADGRVAAEAPLQLPRRGGLALCWMRIVPWLGILLDGGDAGAADRARSAPVSERSNGPRHATLIADTRVLNAHSRRRGAEARGLQTVVVRSPA